MEKRRREAEAAARSLEKGELRKLMTTCAYEMWPNSVVWTVLCVTI